MSGRLTFHPLVQKDLNEILAYYEQEANPEVADHFEAEFRDALAAIKENPRHSILSQAATLQAVCSAHLPSPDTFPGDFDLNPHHGFETCETVTRIRDAAAVGNRDALPSSVLSGAWRF